MKITVQIDGEPKECALLLDALDKIGEEAQKRQLKTSTVTVPTSDLVHIPSNPYPYGTEVTTGTTIPRQDTTITRVSTDMIGGDNG